MPRLKNRRNGVIVNVSEGTAVRLGAEWGDPEAGTESSRSATPDKSWKVADLKSFAADHDPVIDLGDATKKEDILATITAATGPTGSSDGNDGDE